MFWVVFIDKSDRFADLPYSAVMKMASAQKPFRPDQSTISTKIKAKTLTNNERLFARISGNRCSYMDCSLGYQGIDVATWIDIKKALG
jgi:hypothetical protein